MVAGQASMPGLGSAGHESQTLPLPSMSPSSWSALETFGQLSTALSMLSPSRSLGLAALHVTALASSGHGSHASPTPSPSKSPCLPLSTGRTGLKNRGQLSVVSGIPSPSASLAEGTPV